MGESHFFLDETICHMMKQPTNVEVPRKKLSNQPGRSGLARKHKLSFEGQNPLDKTPKLGENCHFDGVH